MCGITGIYAFNLVGKVSMINLSQATEVLSHRGPDFQNGYNDEFVGLGHRRLSIIDPSPAGHQPMADPTGRYWLVYNGEIYNFKKLRSDLGAVEFRSNSDTEVLLHLLIQQGKNCLPKLEGFFSFAFYDSLEKKLLLSIDRYGIKPLYYLKDDNRFLFGSEVNALLQYGIEKSVDFSAISVYFQLNYIPAPLTLFKGIRKLTPGHLIEISPSSYTEECWYKQQLNQLSAPSSYEEAQRKLRSLLHDAVEKRLISDVPLGAFLSGGLDSSIISLLARESSEELNTFSIGFSEEPFFDESSYSTLVANRIGSRHTLFDLTRKYFEDSFESILNHFDEPFADSSAIAYYLLSRETRARSTVALSGDGADELFAGYNKHLAFTRGISGGAVNLAARALSPFVGLLPSSRSGKLSNKIRQLRKYGKSLSYTIPDRYWFLASISSSDDVDNLLRPEVRQQVHSADLAELKAKYLGHLDKNSGLNEFLLGDLNMVLPGDMLTKADRMSMAHGLEVRVPFLDSNVVNFAFSLPPEFKIQGNFRKRILYDTFRKDLPEELYRRPKKGFEVPLLSWINRSSLKYEIAKLTDQDFIEDQGIFEPRYVKKLMRSSTGINPGDAHAKVWALIVFQWWYRRNFL